MNKFFKWFSSLFGKKEIPPVNSSPADGAFVHITPTPTPVKSSINSSSFIGDFTTSSTFQKIDDSIANKAKVDKEIQDRQAYYLNQNPKRRKSDNRVVGSVTSSESTNSNMHLYAAAVLLNPTYSPAEETKHNCSSSSSQDYGSSSSNYDSCSSSSFSD